MVGLVEGMLALHKRQAETRLPQRVGAKHPENTWSLEPEYPLRMLRPYHRHHQHNRHRHHDHRLKKPPPQNRGRRHGQVECRICLLVWSFAVSWGAWGVRGASGAELFFDLSPTQARAAQGKYLADGHPAGVAQIISQVNLAKSKALAEPPHNFIIRHVEALSQPQGLRLLLGAVITAAR